MPLTLRRTKGGPLDVYEGDENLEWLSRVEILASDTQLHTGGRYYQPSGNYTHTPPITGTTFALTVASGTATLTGVIDNEINPVYPAGGERRFVKVFGAWHLATPDPVPVVGGGGDGGPYTILVFGGSWEYAPLSWALNGTPMTLELPATAEEGERRRLVRGDALITVTVADAGLIVGANHETNEIVRRREARMNTPHQVADFVYLQDEWRVAS